MGRISRGPRNRNPGFGWWEEEAEWAGDFRSTPLTEGRVFVLPYKERKRYFPIYDVVGGIEFRDIRYPERKKDYETIIALAREVREREGTKANPYLYELPEWFRERGRKRFATLFYYLQAKALRDEGIERFSQMPPSASKPGGRPKREKR